MKVKQLIRELKKMPQDLEVMYAHHDNSMHETAGNTVHLVLFDKSDQEYECPEYVDDWDRRHYNDLPKRLVIIRG